MSMEVYFRSVNMSMIDIRITPNDSVAERTREVAGEFDQTLGNMINHYLQIYSLMASSSSLDTKA